MFLSKIRRNLTEIGANLHTHRRIFYLVILVAVLLIKVEYGKIKKFVPRCALPETYKNSSCPASCAAQK